MVVNFLKEAKERLENQPEWTDKPVCPTCGYPRPYLQVAPMVGDDSGAKTMFVCNRCQTRFEVEVRYRVKEKKAPQPCPSPIDPAG